jgi:putative transcription factor
MDCQDWKIVSWDKRNERNRNETKTHQINNGLRKGTVVSQLRKNVGNNSDVTKVDHSVIKKIENEEETFKHKTVSLSMSKKIAKARCDKKLSQKDLAFKLNLQIKIIQDYESGKAIPNHMIINKIEKMLECRLRE